jgi:hypothetical protein
LNNYIQNHWPIRLQNRPAEARAFFADHPTAEAKIPGYEVVKILEWGQSFLHAKTLSTTTRKNKNFVVDEQRTRWQCDSVAHAQLVVYGNFTSGRPRSGDASSNLKLYIVGMTTFDCPKQNCDVFD